MKRDGATKSIWQHDVPEFIPADHTIQSEIYDVIIVGGGITGVTTAMLLQKTGKNCILIEAQNLGFGTTSGTTAHLNTILDLTYSEIEKRFGEQNTRLVLQATTEAISLVAKNVEEFNLDCEFSEQPGYLFSLDKKQSDKLDSAYEASLKAGCEVAYSETIPLPVDFKKALLFKTQAQMHPVKYLLGLAKAFEEMGGIILQQCRVTNVKENEQKALEVETEKGKITGRHLIYATHVPPGVNLLHFRCAPYRTYVIAATLNDNNYPEGLAYDLDDPYHYYRTQEIDGQKYLIAGGEDHKTGEEKNTTARYVKLENYLKKFFDIKDIVFKWSSQYFESTDGLPYIGHLPGNPDTVFVATGYGGNGITYSQVAARVLTDLITTGESQYKELFNPLRVKPVAGFSNFVKSAADVVGNLIGKWFASSEIKELAGIAKNEARVIKYKGHSLALYKDENGTVHSVNPACTHIQCMVAWNDTEKTWECPCHGSRFGSDGEMYTAPARKDLEKIDLRDVEEGG
jgi:glycine/D-amino acid oxidase-like deaminating enzyme/nitrite reductase/ring-hydroxylating ferredoxin subunit